MRVIKFVFWAGLIEDYYVTYNNQSPILGLNKSNLYLDINLKQPIIREYLDRSIK